MSAADPSISTVGATIDSLERDTAAALDRAARWQSQSLAELEWSPVDRTPDAVRARATERLDRTVEEAIERIGADGLTDRELTGRAGRLLQEAGWPDGELRALALRHARRAWLTERIAEAGRPFGALDPTDELPQDLRELLPVREPFETPTDALELAAQDRHDLDWSVAAAIRVARQEVGRHEPGDDVRLRDAVSGSLAKHDEGVRADAMADRLARRVSPDRLTAVDALLAGHVALSCALLADRAELCASTVEEWLVAPDPLPIGLAMRASGESAAAIGGALALVAGALGRPLSHVLTVTEALHRMTSDAAGGQLDQIR